MSSDSPDEIRATQNDFIRILRGEYLITGFFWIFSTLGSMELLGGEDGDASTFFLTLAVLMLSNGVWEILTGWYADNFQRHVSMYVGFAACLAGFCLMGIAPLMLSTPKATSNTLNLPLVVWVAGVGIWSLGPALLSGAVEAWMVDRCNFFSKHPPEDFNQVFKKASAQGILAKAIGTVACFAIFSWYLFSKGKPHKELVFGLSAVIAAGLSAWFLYRSYRLREEYWSHPKYQTSEPLFSFLKKAVLDIRKTTYFWFTFGFVGATSLNYIVSSTVWPYLVGNREGKGIDFIAQITFALIAAELIGSWRSDQFVRVIDRVKQPQLRIPVAALLYLVPIPFLFARYIVNAPTTVLIGLIVAAFSFRIVHASVFGSLYAIGQRAIESDERRAVLISISSAISSFLMFVAYFLFFASSPNSETQPPVPPDGTTAFSSEVEQFWRWVPPIFILMVFVGGYLAARPRKEGR